MRRYKITHHTYYNYSGQVTLGPHSLYIRPREDHELRIEQFSLKIAPTAKLLWHRDVEDNSVAIATFNEPTNQMVIESTVTIQQYNENPLNFLVADYAIHYPFQYQPIDTTLLSPYMSVTDQETMNWVNKWIRNFWQPGEPIQTYSLLERLNRYINSNFTYRVREEPGVQPAWQTLSLGTGSCRDFALLFMETARCLGLAARFVSGYLHAPQLNGEPGSTHAWAEVYLPGAGWKGFDPTIGKIVGTDHIAVAVARLPESVTPVEGSFTGPPGSSLTVGVWVVGC